MPKYNSHWNILIKKETGFDIDELVDLRTPEAITWTKGKPVYESWICPNCKEEYDPYDEPAHKFCSNCGKALEEE